MGQLVLLYRLLAIAGLGYVVVQVIADRKPPPEVRSTSTGHLISDDEADEAYREYRDEMSYRYR